MASSPFRLARFPNPPVPLPRVPGPRLAPFTPSAQADIEFIEFLGRENDKDSLVWKVTINGAGPFALKLFFFRHWDFLRGNQAADLATPLADPQLYVDYFEPFNCECRAYGRLKAEKREDLAIKAHGYILLTPQQEAGLVQRVTGEPILPPSTQARNLDGVNFWGRHEQHRGLPVRAIVKDLAAEIDPNPAQAQRMWLDLQALHSIGIFVMDTHLGNYMGGKLVDFSRAWTMYHPALDEIYVGIFQGLLLDELQGLLDYYYQLSNASGRSIYVPQDLEALCSGHLDRYQNFPTTYNWLKWETDADVAAAYVEQRVFKRAA